MRRRVQVDAAIGPGHGLRDGALAYSVHRGRPLSRTVCLAARDSRGAAVPLRRGRLPAYTTIRDASGCEVRMNRVLR